MSVFPKLCMLKPACRKFPSTIGHVFAAKYTQREHLLGSQIGVESEAEIPAHPLRPPVNIALLHLVVYVHPHRFHRDNRTGAYSGSENAMISLAARWFDQNNLPSKASERGANGTSARSLTSGVSFIGSIRAIRQSSVGFSDPRNT